MALDMYTIMRYTQIHILHYITLRGGLPPEIHARMYFQYNNI